MVVHWMLQGKQHARCASTWVHNEPPDLQLRQSCFVIDRGGCAASKRGEAARRRLVDHSAMQDCK